MASLLDYLHTVPDPREKCAYPLGSLLAVCIIGFMCGRTSVSGVARFICERSWDELRSLGFKRCVRPAQHTISRVFSELDADILERHLSQALLVLSGMQQQEGLHHLSLDGKRLCGSVSNSMPRGVHLVSLFSKQLCGVLGQKAVHKGNEITAALALLKETDLTGCVVTGDAIFAQQEICRTIRDKGGHYVFALKDNQRLHKEAAERAFSPETT